MSTATIIRAGGDHESGRRRTSRAYPAKYRAFLRVNRAAARIRSGARPIAERHVPGSRASYEVTLPRKATACSPCWTRPAAVGSLFQARAFAVDRAVVAHTVSPLRTNTTGVRCGPCAVVADR
jgi:hypothetical protein